MNLYKYWNAKLFKTPYHKFWHRLHMLVLLGSTLSEDDLRGESSIEQCKSRVIKLLLNTKGVELMSRDLSILKIY